MIPRHPPRLAGTPEYIFPWRGRKPPVLPKLAAFTCGACLFAAILATRVKVEAPSKSSPLKASVIFLGDSPEGRSLALRAREGGPFPARFDLSQWRGLAEMQEKAIEAVSYQPAPYTPEVDPLPTANELRTLELAPRGKSFFPERKATIAPAPDTAELIRRPVIYPLAGITRETLPQDLPPLAASAAVAPPRDPHLPYRRFLLALTSSGTVSEVVAMEPGAPDLETWLRGVRFAADPAKPSRWIALGVGITNEPARGPDAQ